MHRGFEGANKSPERHPGEGDLLRYIDGELASGKASLLRAHLDACWACRVKVEKIEATIAAFMDYRHQESAKFPAPSADSAFRRRLHELAQQPRARRPFGTILGEIRRIFHVQDYRALVVTGTVILLALMVVIGLKLFWPLRVNAGELLAKASVAEEVKARDVSLVLHRSLVLEKLRNSDRRVLDRRRIEVWHGGQGGVTARRVYDEAGNLLAGEWSQRDGSSEIYRSGARPKSEKQAATVLALLKTPDELWRFDLSARAFQELMKNPAQARVQRQGAYYVVSFAPGQDAGTLLEAVLTVRRDDLRAVGVDLLLATDADAQSPLASAPPAAVRYSIVETRFEEEPAASVQPQLFEPDRELVASEPAEIPQATADLQIETTYLLDQIGATLGQQITVVIGSDHKLHVEGVVETEARKAEILSALLPVRSNPAVSIKVMSYADVLRRARRGTPGTNTLPGAVPAESAAAPAEAELSEYLAAQAPPGQPVDLHAQVRQFSAQAVGDSSEAMRHAWVLKWLADVLTPTAFNGLSGAARCQYLSMMAEHAQQVGQYTRNLRLRLEPVFFPGVAAPPDLTAATSQATPAQTADQLFDAVLHADKAIQSAFSVTVGRSLSVAINTPEFHESLIQSEKLAKGLQSATGSSGCNSETVNSKVNR